MTDDDAPYLRALSRFAGRDPGRLTVPGHKGGVAACGNQVATLGAAAHALDVPTLIPGVDVAGGDQTDALAHAEALAARAWGARRTWFLTGGASQGNLAACLAVAQGGQRVVVQRTAHGSTIDGLIVAGLEPIFVTPEVDERLGIAHVVTPASLDRALSSTPDAAAAFVVSPTYFGAVADIAALAAVAHAHGVPLVVDEAWGAHLPFSDRLPQAALEAGADLVVCSPHKHLGSLTGSALLHLGRDARGLDEARVARALRLVSSTSPSSLLRASLDAARRRAACDGPALLDGMIDALAELRERIGWVPGLRTLDHATLAEIDGVAGHDPLRLVIDVRDSGAPGPTWGRLLRELADIEVELCDEHVVVAVFGLGEDVGATGDRLLPALARARARVVRRPVRAAPLASTPRRAPRQRLRPRDAFLADHEPVALCDAVGRIAAEPVIPYPPGIPLVLPGEELDALVLARARQAVRAGIAIRGAADPQLRTVLVVTEADIEAAVPERATTTAALV
ncbi:MAG: aminotransferase class I/II-fold pyridoxal phosphate-dependent enzyme [Solirubrobacteraceae bacterium]|nr:aminotransferase class I/II-fold pyridoxal phosphate-dependent enzyme [Solirubrobacteraceae bacterium]